MDFIIKPDNEFEYANLALLHPTSLHGGSYFTKIVYRDKPLYIQTPTCNTKQGIIKTGKKFYSDLMFDNNANESFVSWLEEFEEECQKLIHAKGDEWFENKLEMTDIDNAFISCVRIYKSGKYSLVRTTLKTEQETDKQVVKIYDERENEVDYSKITNDTPLITILEFQGIKFTSKTFQIYIEIKQILLVDKEPSFSNCVIRHSIKNPLHLNSRNEEEEKNLEQPPESEKEEKKLEQPPEREEEEKNLEQPPESESEETTFNQELEIDNYLDEFNVKLDMDRNVSAVTIRPPYEIYVEMYSTAVEKAKKSKQEAFEAFLEAKNIKSKYNLEESDTDIDIDDELEELSEIDKL